MKCIVNAHYRGSFDYLAREHISNLHISARASQSQFIGVRVRESVIQSVTLWAQIYIEANGLISVCSSRADQLLQLSTLTHHLGSVRWPGFDGSERASESFSLSLARVNYSEQLEIFSIC